MARTITTFEGNGAKQTYTAPVITSRSLPFISQNRTESAGEYATIEEALKATGTDFTVAQEDVFVAGRKVPTAKANVRTDTGEVLAITGNRYTVVQTRDALELGNELFSTGEANIDTAWSLRGGRMVGVTFRIPGADIAVPGDEGGNVQMYGMMRTSHDGSTGTTFDIGPVRLSCLNMVPLFRRKAEISWALRHTSGIHGKLAQIRRSLGLTYRYSEGLQADIQRYLNMTMVERDVVDLLNDLYPVSPDLTDVQKANTANAGILRNWQESDNLAPIRETAWGLINAANEYYEHVVPVRSSTYDSTSARGVSILMGTARRETNRVAAAVRAR